MFTKFSFPPPKDFKWNSPTTHCMSCFTQNTYQKAWKGNGYEMQIVIHLIQCILSQCISIFTLSSFLRYVTLTIQCRFPAYVPQGK